MFAVNQANKRILLIRNGWKLCRSANRQEDYWYEHTRNISVWDKYATLYTTNDGVLMVFDNKMTYQVRK
uniref:Uncharacterized protein n=1 Tax=viral metagenome TaxID=1070528 RepID=A0A6C0B2J2_9ZZZZ